MRQNKDGELKLFNLFGHFSLLLVIFLSALNAQSFADFKKSQSVSFQSYKDERDNAFNKYLKQQWTAYKSYNGKSLYEEQKPEKMPMAKPQKEKPVGPTVTIEIQKTIAIKKETKQVNVGKGQLEERKDIYIDYFGSKLGFDIPIRIKQASFYPQNQKGIVNFFSSVASSKYEDIVLELQQESKKMGLNDWGVYLLVSKLSNSVFKNQDNARLFSWFIFNKMGYAVKIGLADKHVVVLHYSQKMIYLTPHYNFGDKKYYALSYYAKGKIGRLFSYNQDYPEANKPMDLSLTKLPIFPLDKKQKNIGFSEFGISYRLELEYNQNILNFMSTYPQADYKTYFNAPVEDMTFKEISIGLKKYIDGKKASEAMNFVLSFVQKSFKYERDNEQFGRDRVMFAQETLFFDKSDCEDRAILYAFLMRELFHVSVIGVQYKDHMATALYVPMNGDSVKIGSRKYVIADPTYINASIGMSIPRYKNIIPKKYIVIGK